MSEAYEAAVEQWAANPPPAPRTAQSLLDSLSTLAGIRVIDRRRNVRARSWDLRLANDQVVRITDQDTPAEWAQKLQDAAALPGNRPAEPRTGEALDRLFAAAGGVPEGTESQVWSAEKDRRFSERGWLLQFIADVILGTEIRDGMEYQSAREYVAQAFIPDSATDEAGITAIRGAREALAKRLARAAANPTPQAPEEIPYIEALG